MKVVLLLPALHSMVALVAHRHICSYNASVAAAIILSTKADADATARLASGPTTSEIQQRIEA
eukprot:scaffold440997_cov19-Prasinocladus_malaysianus.AAC.1